MLTRLALLGALTLFIISCIKGPDIQSAAADISLTAYGNLKILDQTLQQKVSIQYGNESDLTDTMHAVRDRKLPVSLTRKNRYHYNYFLHFNEEQEIITENFRQELLTELAQQSFHPQIDSLQIVIVDTEATVPYFDGNEMISHTGQAINSVRSGRNKRFQTIGPSRVNLEVKYACYADGKVLRSSKSVRQNVSPMPIGGQYRGSRSEIITSHLNECYVLMNELIRELSVDICRELKSGFERR